MIKMVYSFFNSCTRLGVRPKNESTLLSLHIFKLPHLARWAHQKLDLPPHYSLPRAHSCALSRDLASRRADARRRSSSLMGDHVFCWRSCGAACPLGWSAQLNAKPRCKRVYIYTSADIHSEPSKCHATQCKYSRMECRTWVCHPWVASYRW